MQEKSGTPSQASDERKRLRSIKKLFKSYYGEGPWQCGFCPGVITALGPNGHVHHRDHDFTNNVKENLTVAHKKCHEKHHAAFPGPNTGRKWSEETKAKTSATLKGRKLSPETRAKMSAARQRDREAIRERTLRAWSEGRGKNQWTKR